MSFFVNDGVPEVVSSQLFVEIADGSSAVSDFMKTSPPVTGVLSS